MLLGIDISNWQKGFDVASCSAEFVIAKATEGTGFVDRYCDGFVQAAISSGKPFGFYHYLRPGDAAAQARYFEQNTKGYEGRGIPCLDFEEASCTNDDMETFVKEYHAITGVYPWVYMSADFVNNRGYGTDYVKKHCGLWLAGYPVTYASYPAVRTCPYSHDGWTLAAWQFGSQLPMGGMRVDGDIFYGDENAWDLYATAGANYSSADGAVEGQQHESLTSLDYEVARDVIDGMYGNGQDRKDALGDRYESVQRCVNRLIKASDNELASDVIAGLMGNGELRKRILGERYVGVQTAVNRALA